MKKDPSSTESILQGVRQRAAMAREEAVARRLAGSEARRLYMQTLHRIVESRRERMESFDVQPPFAVHRPASLS